MGKDKFELALSNNDMFAIELINPGEEERSFLKSVILNNWTEDTDYKYSKKASPFIQCDSSDYLLIEFWNPRGIDEFIEYLNNRWKRR